MTYLGECLHTISDILRLPLKYTEEEIEFNKLKEEHHNAFKSLANDTKFVFSKLKKYGFSKYEVEKFIHEKIFIQQEKSSESEDERTWH